MKGGPRDLMDLIRSHDAPVVAVDYVLSENRKLSKNTAKLQTRLHHYSNPVHELISLARTSGVPEEHIVGCLRYTRNHEDAESG